MLENGWNRRCLIQMSLLSVDLLHLKAIFVAAISEVTAITQNQFWTLIETRVDRDALRDLSEDDYPDSLVQPLTKELAKLSVQEIQGFKELLAKALYDLDGRPFGANGGDSRTSDDGFLYCRCWVVATGREYYETFWQTPRKCPRRSLNCVSHCFM